jgi:hypothetical protein
LISVNTFIDWNTQIHYSSAFAIDDPILRAKHTLERTARIIENVLKGQDVSGKFRVRIRLYHGWHKGFEPTANRRAIILAVAGTDFSALSRSPAVIFSPEVQYGDFLLTALPTRLLARPMIHLPNTLRQQDRSAEPTEKMVDTALAADLLSWARNDPSEWALVLADDDDLVPPAFVAEAWTVTCGGRILLVRHRHSRNFLRLDGLVVEVRA